MDVPLAVFKAACLRGAECSSFGFMSVQLLFLWIPTVVHEDLMTSHPFAFVTGELLALFKTLSLTASWSKTSFQCHYFLYQIGLVLDVLNCKGNCFILIYSVAAKGSDKMKKKKKEETAFVLFHVIQIHLGSDLSPEIHKTFPAQ